MRIKWNSLNTTPDTISDTQETLLIFFFPNIHHPSLFFNSHMQYYSNHYNASLISLLLMNYIGDG